MEKALQLMTIDDINNAESVEIDVPDESSGDDESLELAGEQPLDDQYAAFKRNLAEDIDPGILSTLASDILAEILTDKNSKKDWEKTVTEGIQLLGLTIEERTEPWKGACGVYHSVLTEAVIKFQAEMIMETFPATGPVQTKILGKWDKEKEAAAARVREDMNWQLMNNMPEYRPEHERLLWNLGFAGSAFKKIYFDPNLGRQTALFVPAEDVLLPYGCSDITTGCPRLVQIMKKTENEMLKLMDAGFYLEIDLGEPDKIITTLETKKAKISGINPVDDNRYTIYEAHTEKYIEGLEESDPDSEIAHPYVVTLNQSGDVFAVYRNWHPEDKMETKRDHFVQYTMIPGFGPYGMGYVHILGGYAKGATSVLRQLVDAGTLANLPGGLKARGLRIKGDDTPIAPGEFRDVDVPAGTIKDNIINLPYKEPSATLLSLFKEMVEEARGLASTADMKVADMNQQAPVGTTLAIIERMQKVMSAVQARVHNAMRREFVMLRDIIRDYTEEEYDYESERGHMIKQSDYEKTDVLPISDPNASSTSQRIAQYQAALQLSSSAPQIYNLPELHRETLTALGMKNASKIIPDKEDMKPKDPVIENMSIMNAKPVQAFIYQDHEAHIAVHMALAQDPTWQAVIGQNPQAAPMQAALQAHLMEHMAFQYRVEIEQAMGVSLPDIDEEMSEEMETQISRLIAEAAPQVLAMHSQKAAAAQAQQTAQDPLLQIQQKQLEIKGQDVQRKAAKDQADSQVKGQELQIKQATAKILAMKTMSEIEAKKETMRNAQEAPMLAAMQSNKTEQMRHERENAARDRQHQLDVARAAQTERMHNDKLVSTHITQQQKMQHDKNIAGFNAGIASRKLPGKPR